ncbi:MAG: tRNA(Ile)-lysidine synthase [Solirubrobacteraceae bacterium]|nr:tRNA(Ile)-lysidine synthase [Solirubrobacteraceae bacterium]
MPPADDLLERVRSTGLLAPDRPVVVLLSGGRDSVCLLDVAVRLAGQRAVGALHVNYGLRRESGEDEAHCRALCERLGVPLDVHLARRPEGPGNLQAWARDVRLGTGARLAVARGARLATGHTASDQAETVLYRLAASPGRRALLGMAARDGLLVRPLLGATRAQTAAHCTARGLAWREDASNDSPAYARNRARANLLPALRELHPAAEANVVRTAELLRDEAAVLDEVVETALAGRDEIAIERLAALPPALARLVLRRLAEAAAGRLCARAPGRLPDLLELGDGALDLGDGARAVVRRGILRVEPTPPGRAAPAAVPDRAVAHEAQPHGVPAAPPTLPPHARRSGGGDPRPAG